MSPPVVVALGGGHGLSATLHALRLLPVDPVAVVSVADDGGSTGRLRADADRMAPGDLRKCLVALAGESSALTDVMEHRFESGELEGHAFGNLMLAAFEESTGSILEALAEVSALIGVQGRVLPATAVPVELVAELDDGSVRVGQAVISATAGVRHVSLDPEPVACEGVLDAISSADAVILGPGSLYTSVLAAVAVPQICKAIAEPSVPVIYVCNLGPQSHETDGYSVADHVSALAAHSVLPDVVLYDPDQIGEAEGVPGARAATLARDERLVHDPDLLARAISEILTT